MFVKLILAIKSYRCKDILFFFYPPVYLTVFCMPRLFLPVLSERGLVRLILRAACFWALHAGGRVSSFAGCGASRKYVYVRVYRIASRLARTIRIEAQNHAA